MPSEPVKWGSTQDAGPCHIAACCEGHGGGKRAGKSPAPPPRFLEARETQTRLRLLGLHARPQSVKG